MIEVYSFWVMLLSLLNTRVCLDRGVLMACIFILMILGGHEHCLLRNNQRSYHLDERESKIISLDTSFHQRLE